MRTRPPLEELWLLEELRFGLDASVICVRFTLRSREKSNAPPRSEGTMSFPLRTVSGFLGRINESEISNSPAPEAMASSSFWSPRAAARLSGCPLGFFASCFLKLASPRLEVALSLFRGTLEEPLRYSLYIFELRLTLAGSAITAEVVRMSTKLSEVSTTSSRAVTLPKSAPERARLRSRSS